MEKHRQDSEVEMTIRFEENVSTENAQLVCQWSNSLGKDFQEQWMGPTIEYPLNYSKLKSLDNLYSIFADKEFIGVIQQVRIYEDNIHIGRFIINPSKTGMGYGKESLKEFINYSFKNAVIKSISLTVFGYNKSAKALYEKLGFKIVETINKPDLKYIMKKYR